MPALGQHLDDLARDAVALLDRLVRVGVGTKRDRVGAISGAGQLRAQQLGRIGLGEQPGFEIQPGREFEIAVRRPRIAVAATVLAAAVGIDRLGEGEIGRRIAADDAARTLLGDARLRRCDRLAVDEPAIVLGWCRERM
jgi:hypothetical protein